MNQGTWRIAQVLAVLQLVKALELHGVYTFELIRFTSDQPMSLFDWAISFASVLFFLLPIATVIRLFRHSLWGFFPLIIFPIVATIFGAIPVPFSTYLYSSDVHFMSKVIIAVNLVFVGIGVLLFKDSRARVAASQ